MFGRLKSILDQVVTTNRYEAGRPPSQTDRYNPSALSVVSETIDDLPRLVAKSRDLIQNNELAAAFHLQATNGAVGWGIHPYSATDVDDFNELVDRKHLEWGKTCEPNGLDVFGVQCQAVAAMFGSGESFVVAGTPPPDMKMKVPLWFRIYEADMVDWNFNQMIPGGRIVQGIEYDKWERPVAYHFHRYHPGDPFQWDLKGQKTDHIRIPQSRVIHLLERHMARPSQPRGIPRLSPVINTIRNLSDFQMTELIKQKVAACFGFIFTGVEDDATNNNTSLFRDARGRVITDISPGLLGYAPKGSTTTVVQGPKMDGYWDYIKGHQHGVATGVGVPYARLTGDLKDVNFSSSRIGEGYFVRQNDALQWLSVIQLLCNRMWTMFISAAFDAGVLTVPVVPVTWTTQQFPSTNPVDDANARRAKLRDGVWTLSDAIAAEGDNPRVVLNNRAKENALLDKLELVFDSDPRHRTLAGVTQPVYDTGNGTGSPQPTSKQ